MSNILEMESMTCTGCGACINVCPVHALYYSKDKYGFTTPAIDKEKCINCGKCLRHCPRYSINDYSQPIKAFAAINKNNDDLMQSSSGGVFSAIAKFVLENRGVVFGCTMDDTQQVYHISIENNEDLKKIRRSKYIQSFMGDCFISIKKALMADRWVLVSGTPCIIAGVQSFLIGVDTSKLLLVDIVCHGIPSQDFFDSYFENLEKKYGGVSDYQFRTKTCANNGMSWLHSYYVDGGKKRIVKNWPEDSFNFLYMNSYIYRDSCYNCKYANTNRRGDFSLCDYWNWEQYHDDFAIDSSVSGILINSQKGLDVWEKIKKDFQYSKTDVTSIVKNNGCLVRPSNRPSEREKVLDFWMQNGYKALDDEFNKRERINIYKNKLYRLAPKVVKELYSSIRKKRGR